MTVKKNILFLFLAFTSASSAQQNSGFSLEDLIPGGKTYAKFRPEMPRGLRWEGDKLLYEKNGKTLFLETNEEIDFALPQPQALAYPAGAENKDGEAFTLKNNLFLLGKGTKAIPITNYGETIVSGQSTSRNEFGTGKGTFWAPNKSYLAFYQKNEANVGDYPLVDVSAREARLKSIKYPMAGMGSEKQKVGVYNVQSNSTIYLKTDTTDEHYITNLAWSPDEKTIYLAEINREQNNCKLNSYDAETGAFLKTLFTETHKKYVEPMNAIVFLPDNPKQFVWQSRRDGYNHFYLYNVEGKLVKQLTKGAWEVIGLVGFADKGRKIIYYSKEESPLDNHIYSVDIKSLKKQKLSKEAGVHHAILSGDGSRLADIYSSQFVAGKVAVTETATNKTKVVYEAKNPFDNYKMPEISLGTIKAADGSSDLYYRLIKPVDFDSAKQHPAVVYVYGGPHSQTVSNSFNADARGWDIYMAQKGYVVFTLDNRGTSHRGFAFENVTHRQLGVEEGKDQIRGVDFLKSLPYVDGGRIGVHGWSYGGFMTISLLLDYPDVFKVGVAGGPVIDWKYYEVMYGERYMDTPQENPEGYEKTSLLNKAGKLKSRLLIIHGDEDPTVVWQNSLMFLKSCVRADTHPDYFIYTGHGHNMTGRDRVHLHKHITRYFEDFLPPAEK
ncbi:MAG: S9 family peptidase [Dysgonamonadaceae bacterium]|jgi:dipeptidyl-peptidase-4|nr:S9 family peptidase [Dysgonamonadaceae bacterium]